jgi:hypothetical protein
MSAPRLPGYVLKPNDAATALAQRFKKAKDQPDPAPEPDYKDDILERIDVERNVSLDSGPSTIIDVQPDYRYSLITVIYHVIRIYSTLDQRNNPMITPASLTAYSLAIIYAYALISDSENIRTVKSSHADDFLDNPTRKDLLIELERCAVPPFLRNILTGLSPTFDPRRTDIMFVNSLAGFSFYHDYGRSFPISMFLKAHHIVATCPSNQDPITVFNDWSNKPVIDGNNPVYIGQIIGSSLTTGTYDSWLLQRIRTLFNPVTSRSNTNRPTFTPLPTFPPLMSLSQINPYIYLLNADEDNIYNTVTFIRSMSAIIGEQIKGSSQLGTLFDTPSGVQIMTHFYHGPALPTWHWFVPKEGKEELSAKRYAETLKFLFPQPNNKATVPLKYPTDPTTIETPLYLVRKDSKNPDSDDDRQMISFDLNFHVAPDVRYFDPYAYTPSTLAFTMMTGLCIESEEIDGFAVPQPNPGISLNAENSFILESSLPLRLVQLASEVSNGNGMNLYHRSISSQNSSAISVSLYDMSQNILPYFKTRVIDALPVSLHGFKTVTGIERFSKAFSKFGFRTSSIDEVHEINVPPKSIYAWSSYRHINTHMPRSSPLRDKTYMIINFRTIYGTNVTMSQSVHPSRLIPLA